ncbi:conserved Plasmodium protein, unknown function [Plasmodium sp. DRC-Itaito]|uniref:SF-assemblin n=1 Tax=Plasmodium gaboni TaxID=647221 RepID=A0ABY1UKV0_9APIC|nr:conserved Plasmodium protein, unknown function [Plasmodium sp. gorilla clade G2]SOV12742.1 conserved Plasmodium protein, unknown function [Plasmodium gaboni]SOV12780.1 conserved Plasmodium protein, unknown function [Plasmodium sp. gorilla clade G2]SOV21840.1 conserved Plasmodium protein, unknown function [Plasmodium sp. DRC-Itaito]
MEELNKSGIYSKQFSLSQNKHNSERLQRLEKRLSGLHFSIELQKNEKIDKLNEKINTLEEKLIEMHENSNKTFEKLNEKLNDIRNDVTNYKNELEEFKNDHKKKLQLLEEKAEDFINKEKEDWSRLKIKLVKDFQHKAALLKEEMVEEYGLIEEKEDSLRKYYDCEINNIKSIIQNEISERIKTEKIILSDVDDKINEIIKIIRNEKTTRETYSENLVSLIEQYFSRIKKEIDMERLEREDTEETLVHLMEEALDKIGIPLA